MCVCFYYMADKHFLSYYWLCLLLQVAEHAAWLSTNCTNQLDYYTKYLGQHQMPGSSSSRSSSNGSSSSSAAAAGLPPQTAISSSSSGGGSATAITSVDVAAAVAAASGSQSLAAVADFKPAAARTLLEAEIREAFLGTAGSAAGEAGSRLIPVLYCTAVQKSPAAGTPRLLDMTCKEGIQQEDKEPLNVHHLLLCTWHQHVMF
jgi:hypothetical protein